MGYEILYIYHDIGEDGFPDKSEEKTMRKKLGDAMDDVPLEQLASAILAQRGRRDLYIVKVQCYEFTKKEVSIRDTKGGIIIKNKKFTVDDSTKIVVQEVTEPGNQLVPVQRVQESNGVFQPHNQGMLRPIKWVVFAPELPLMAEVRQKGLRFTVDKKYPVFQETPHPTGIGNVYKSIDDANREQLISDKYFIPAEITLLRDRDGDDGGFKVLGKGRDVGNLSWHGVVAENDMPKLR